MKKAAAVFVSVLFVVLVLSGIVSGVAGKQNSLVVEGSTTILPIMQSCAAEFKKGNPGADIKVIGGGSGAGINSLIACTCDIGASSRPLKEAELSDALSKKIDIKAHVIAMDGIVVIVNAKNPVESLNKIQVFEIFTGKTSNWSQVGGANEKISVVSRDEKSGTHESFSELALFKNNVVQSAVIKDSNQSVVDMVSKTPGAIGYVGIGNITEAVKTMKIDGIAPSKEVVLSGKYPYARPLLLYLNGAPSGIVKDFLGFVLGDNGQKIVDQQGFIKVK